VDPQTIRGLLRKQPFEPFAILVANGRRHEIRQPEFVLVTPSRLVVVDPVTDHFSLESMSQVVEFRVIDATTA